MTGYKVEDFKTIIRVLTPTCDCARAAVPNVCYAHHCLCLTHSACICKPTTDPTIKSNLPYKC